MHSPTGYCKGSFRCVHFTKRAQAASEDSAWWASVSDMESGNTHKKQEYLLTLVFQNESGVLLFKKNATGKPDFFSFSDVWVVVHQRSIFIQCTILVHSMLSWTILRTHLSPLPSAPTPIFCGDGDGLERSPPYVGYPVAPPLTRWFPLPRDVGE